VNLKNMQITGGGGGDGSTHTHGFGFGFGGLAEGVRGDIVVSDSAVRGSFFDRILHSRMPLDPTHVSLKLLHACDQ
jgi:hypothetical protein